MNPQETKMIERAVRKLTKREIRDVVKQKAPHYGALDNEDAQDRPAPLGFAEKLRLGGAANEDRSFTERVAHEASAGRGRG